MTGLRLAPGLQLPLEAVTETFAILGRRGKGKTNTAVVLVEELIGAGQPTVVIDPTGVWWGLRSSPDGKRAGLPVVIFGGEHGDLPLDAAAGSLVADTVVDHRHPVVIDLSLLSKTTGRRFVTDFMERLYHRNRDVLHVVVDEADLYAPQRATADTARLLGAMDDIVRRGRAHGLGVTLITQRAAVINKDVLSQVEVLIAMGMTGPRDIAAIDEWVRAHADEETAREVKATLAGLPTGTAWVWSPSWLDLLVKVKVRARSTFDSSATPKPGQQRATPRAFAPVDVAALGERMAALAEQVTAADPKTLQARVRAAEDRAARAETALAEALSRPPQIVEAMPAAAADTIGSVLLELENMRATVPTWMDKVAEALRGIQESGTPVREPAAAPHAPPTAAPAPAPAPAPARAAASRSTRETVVDDADPTLGKAQRAVLTVLATYGTRPIGSVAVLTGYSAKGGGFRNALSALRTAGLIDGRGDLTITDAGRASLGTVEPLPTGEALREHWKAQPALGKAEGLILDVLAAAYPSDVDVADVANQAGYSPSGGGFRNALSRLRSLGLIHGRAQVVLDGDLANR